MKRTNYSKFILYYFLAIVTAVDIRIVSAKKDHNKTQQCKLENVSKALYGALFHTSNQNRSIRAAKDNINAYYNLARKLGESSKNSESVEFIGDFLSQLYFKYKNFDIAEYTIDDCSIENANQDFLEKVDDKYEAYVALSRQKLVQAQHQLKLAKAESRRLTRLIKLKNSAAPNAQHELNPEPRK